MVLEALRLAGEDAPGARLASGAHRLRRMRRADSSTSEALVLDALRTAGAQARVGAAAALGKDGGVTVYVDDMYLYAMGRFGRMKMSHLVADTEEELLAMADRIGLHRRWLQHPGKPGRVHFDVSMTMRRKAIAAGAVEMTLLDLARMRIARGREATR